MGSRSKYKPRSSKKRVSKLVRRMLRSQHDTFTASLAGEFAASARSRKPSKRARGKKKKHEA